MFISFDRRTNFEINTTSEHGESRFTSANSLLRLGITSPHLRNNAAVTIKSLTPRPECLTTAARDPASSAPDSQHHPRGALLATREAFARKLQISDQGTRAGVILPYHC